MPWSNVPKALWPKMESCTSALKKQGKSESSANAICYKSVVGGGVADAAKRRGKGK